MKILKAIGRTFAGLFVLLGLTIYLMSSFGSYALKNSDVLEQDLSNNQYMQTLLEKNGVDFNQMKEYCNQNPGDENCKILNENPLLTAIEKEITDFSYYGNMMRIFGIIFFIIGLLLFVWCGGWLIGLIDTFTVSFIGTIFSYIFYRYSTSWALNNFLPKELLTILNDWITISLNQTSNLILVLGVIFLILTIGLYILKYKTFKKSFIKKEERKDGSGR